MRKLLFAMIAVAITTGLFAQSYVAQVLVLNEGYFDYVTNEIITPVTIGSYDPASDIYTTVATINDARFASDILIDGDCYYVAADQFLLKYDLNTHALLDIATVQGIRKIAVSGDEIVVTRGEYLVALPSYVQVFDKTTLDLQYEIPAAALPHTTEGVVIDGGIAYIAVNNGFVFGEEVGYIAQLDLETASIIATTDLGADGINPDNLMIEGEYIYTLNNKDFTGSSVSAYRITTGELSTVDLANISAGCGTSAIAGGDIYYQEMFGTTLSRFDPATAEITGEEEYGFSFYGLDFDPVDANMYVSETDYFSYGIVHMYTSDGTLSGSFDAGVSPGNFAFDVRLGSAVVTEAVAHIEVYPNPAVDHFTVSVDAPVEFVVISDLSGKVMQTVHGSGSPMMDIAVDALPAGSYFISVTTTGQVASTMITKL